MSDSWYEQGVSDEALRQVAEEAQSLRKQRRFWLKPDSSKTVIMLDDEPFRIWEHNLEINGSFVGNNYTCRSRMGECPLCLTKYNRYHIGFVTVLDVDGFVGSNGEQIKNFRLLLPMKTETLKLFNAKKNNKTSLVGAKFVITRTSSQAAGCGNDFDFQEYVDLDKEQQYWAKSRKTGELIRPEPYEYMKIFKPMSVDMMRGLVNQINGAVVPIGSGGGDEDVPY